MKLYPNDILGIEANDIIDGKDGKRKDRYNKIQKQVQESGSPESLFICVCIDNEIGSLLKGFVNFEGVLEDEKDSHVTVFYSPNVEGLSSEAQLSIMEEHMSSCKDISFEIDHMEVFEGVAEGTRDCLVVRVIPCEELKQVQAKIIETLESKGATSVEQTYPDWKPHLTLGYFPVGKAPELEELPKVTLYASAGYVQYGGDESGEKRYFL